MKIWPSKQEMSYLLNIVQINNILPVQNLGTY